MLDALVYYLIIFGVVAVIFVVIALLATFIRSSFASKAPDTSTTTNSKALSDNYKKLTELNDKLSKENLNMEQELRLLRLQVEDRKLLGNQFIEAQGKITSMQDELTKLNTEKQNLNAHCQNTDQENLQLKQQLESTKSELSQLQANHGSLQNQVQSLVASNGALQSQLYQAQNTIQNQANMLQQSESAANHTISVMQGRLDALENSKNENLQHSLSSLLNPLQKELLTFKEALYFSVEQNRSNTNDMLRELYELKGIHQLLQAQSNSLSRALRRGGAIQGLWGEISLERLLEYAGLIRGVHYQSHHYSCLGLFMVIFFAEETFHKIVEPTGCCISRHRCC